jgi:plasmid stability protein
MVAFMATITLKGIPPTLHRALKRQAEQHRRSLNQEVLATLENKVPKPTRDVDALLREIEEFRKSLRFVTTPEEIDAAKREGRA